MNILPYYINHQDPMYYLYLYGSGWLGMIIYWGSFFFISAAFLFMHLVWYIIAKKTIAVEARIPEKGKGILIGSNIMVAILTASIVIVSILTNEFRYLVVLFACVVLITGFALINQKTQKLINTGMLPYFYVMIYFSTLAASMLVLTLKLI
jgi:hypothetical protein